MAVFRSVKFALVFGASLLSQVSAIGSPTGFASGTTGGGSATAQTPSSPAELLSWLADSTARVIVLSSIYDFTNYYGTTTGEVCSPYTCTNNPQMMINGGSNNWCSPYSSTITTATYYNSGTSTTYSLKVGSNKTLLGKGSNGGIKGIGLLIQNANNVIIQNIKITDINAKYVWGGDAISIQGSTKVWVDHNTIQNIGRQMIVTGYDPAKQVTISNNLFDGRTTYSPYCDGHHYWVALFLGSADTITFANNMLYMTSGRGPHSGGQSGNYQYVHLVNNYFVDITNHAVDAEVGTTMLVEGNYFNTVKQPSMAGTPGQEYFIQTSSDASACTSKLGRTCQTNTLTSSDTVASRVDSTVLTQLAGQSAVTGYKPMSASDAATYVQANKGVGIIN